MSTVNRLIIKCLRVVNICNNLVTVHLEWTEAIRGGIQIMFTDPLTIPINRPHGDHPRGWGDNVYLLLNP
jgi:hypothetical protein